jgi:ABC-type microcin C transport system duplicated ATPase subunit YejF
MNALLDVGNLRVTFPTPRGPIEVVKGVSFTLGRERLGIVGESGSGKSIHQHCLSSQRFILRRPNSTPLIVPSTTVVLSSFHGATLSSGIVASRENWG